MEKDKITIVILGDGGAGKSCITMRLLRSKWVDEYDPTIEDSYTTTRDVDGQTYRLDIIDTAGQEEYREMLGSLFSADTPIDAYLLVYDITSQTSLETLEIFDELIQKNVESGLRPSGAPAPVKVVAGNKSDLSESRAVPSAEGYAWAKAHGCGFMETSAKVMVNIEETFEIIIRQVVRNRIEAAGGNVKGSSGLANNNNNNTNTNTTNINAPSQSQMTGGANTQSNLNNTQQVLNTNNNNFNEKDSQPGVSSARPNTEKPAEPKKRGCCVIC